MSPDVIIIGGGHNALVAATLLAKRRKKVLLLEARDEVGGAAAPRTFHEGYTLPGLLHETRGFRPEVESELGLKKHGFSRRSERGECYAPVEGESGLWIQGDSLRGEGLSDEDRATFKEHHAFVGRLSKVIRKVMTSPAPDPLGSPWPLLTMGLSVRMLGERDMIELARVAPTCAADWMRDRFSSERLCAALASRAVHFGYVGPWAANTAANLLVDECLDFGEVQGGPAAVVAALRAAAEAAGVEIRTEARVTSLIIKRDAVRGVRLESGEEIESSCVGAGVDPRKLFLDMIGTRQLEVPFAQRARNIRARGSAAKVHLALKGPLVDSEGKPLERMLTGETLDDVERAYDALKYGEMSERPVLDVWVPTQVGAGAAPEGHHVVSILAHAAPFALKGGWDDAARELLQSRVLDELSRHCPDVRDQIVGSETLTPADLAHEYGLSEGNLMHVEHAPDQLLFMRPTIECGSHDTPIEGLFLCGSGAHPGGGVTGAPGILGARALLSSL